MKKLFVVAALLMATTSAHAGNSISFEINGKKVRIEAPDHCDQLSCIKISAPGLSGADFGFKGGTSTSNGRDDGAAPRTNSVPPPSAAAPVEAAAPQAVVTATGSASPGAAVSAPPAATAAPTSAPPAADNAVAAAPLANSAAAPTPTPVAPAQVSPTPLGVWATEEHKGMVRIEPCGPDLCGYAVKTGEKILINMKPSETKWSGRIHDPDSGRNYDSTIAMKGPNALRVQGCAFGGLFCGGQTWSRVS
jgi:uncharacterized protein (DUF2147 family)